MNGAVNGPGRSGPRSPEDASAERTSDPIDAFERQHRRLRQMCDGLEAIADSLPDQVDCGLCAFLAGELRVNLPGRHRREEQVLFPLIELRAEVEDTVGPVLARLRHEHSLDEGYAAELGDLLDTLSREVRPANPDMVGYMLRGFFECYRRHVHLEQVVILPLARSRLTDADLQHLGDRLGDPGYCEQYPSRQNQAVD
jgi:hemerythrin-like domain-containing protein